MKISIIAALDEARGIGKNNDLLFRIPADFARMKQLTLGHPIIMGRKTFESIGRALPGRTNIIITRDKNYAVEGAVVVHSLEDALRQAQGKNEEIFIFGGGQIFLESMNKGLVDRLYLTIVKGNYHADTFFPEYEKEFKNVIKREEHSENGYTFTFLDLEK